MANFVESCWRNRQRCTQPIDKSCLLQPPAIITHKVGVKCLLPAKNSPPVGVSEAVWCLNEDPTKGTSTQADHQCKLIFQTRTAVTPLMKAVF